VAYVVGEATVYMAGAAAAVEKDDVATGAAAIEYVATGAAATDMVAGAVIEAIDADMAKKVLPEGRGGMARGGTFYPNP